MSGVEADTVDVGRLNVCVLSPAPTVTLDGGKAAFDPVSAIVAPFAGAPALRVMVTLTFVPPVTGEGDTPTDCSVTTTGTGLTVSDVEAVEPL